MFADSTAIVAGSLLGTSSTTAYVESASGVQAGGRTGLTALTIAVLFLAALFIAPLAASVPGYATAPALLYVAGLMMHELVDIEWSDVTESTPAALTALMIPFTYSIANGLAFGFISYVVLKTLTGRDKCYSSRYMARCNPVRHPVCNVPSVMGPDAETDAVLELHPLSPKSDLSVMRKP